LRKTDRLEVNHIAQARGAHRELSCLHHLDNLETLCLDCHREETAAQRGYIGQYADPDPRAPQGA
jgi:hypothetical protein